MKIVEVIQLVTRFFNEYLNKEGVVIGLEVMDTGWRVEIEIAEEVEYMRKRGRDDLLAIYEVVVNKEIEISGFKRISFRERDSADM